VIWFKKVIRTERKTQPSIAKWVPSLVSPKMSKTKLPRKSTKLLFSKSKLSKPPNPSMSTPPMSKWGAVPKLPRGQFLFLLLLLLLPGDGAGMCPARCSCSQSTQSVSCTSASLAHVPHFLAPDTTTLDLSDNSIVKLESGLTYYTELIRVNISSNNLHSLGRNQFSSLSELTVLDLSNNRLSKIRQGAFAGLHSLDQLDLRHNSLERLGAEVFTGLVGLKRLDLSHNKVSEIHPDAFLHLRDLVHLNLGKNSLSTIVPTWLSPLLTLKTLDLSQNLILRLEIASESLTEIDLSDNMLSSLPTGSINIPTLTSLNLAYNKLVEPPSAAIPLPHLRSLALSGNMIRRLGPSAFAHLPSLVELQLSALPRLETLAPLSLRDLHNLSSLELASCRRLKPLPVDLFATTPNLQVLDFSHLGWTSLPASLLPSSLKEIKLDGLPLTCDCSLLWLWEVEQHGKLKVEGAQCDGTALVNLQVDRLACDQGDYLLVIAALGGVMALLIILAMIGALVKWCLGRRQLAHSSSSKLHCDYLQYTSVPPPPSSPPGKPYYSATVGRGGGLDAEGLYYTLQPVYSSSSGSASSDPAACPNSSSTSSSTTYPINSSNDPNASSSSYSSPVQYPHFGGGGGGHSSGSPAHFGNPHHTSGTQFGGTASGAHFGSTTSGVNFGGGGPPGTPLMHHSPIHLLTAVEPQDGAGVLLRDTHPQGGGHPQGGTMFHQGSPQWGPQGTQKKRTLVKYRYPDVLPSDNNSNQNYYV